jgi:hypothetical protein
MKTVLSVIGTQPEAVLAWFGWHSKSPAVQLEHAEAAGETEQPA